MKGNFQSQVYQNHIPVFPIKINAINVSTFLISYPKSWSFIIAVIPVGNKV